MSGRRTWQVLLMLGGLIAWAVQFTIIYGATSTLCGREWADATFLGFNIVPLTISTATLILLVVTGFMLLWSLRERRGFAGRAVSAPDSFMSQASVLINGLSLVVILWQGIPAFILPACA